MNDPGDDVRQENVDSRAAVLPGAGASVGEGWWCNLWFRGGAGASASRTWGHSSLITALDLISEVGCGNERQRQNEF